MENRKERIWKVSRKKNDRKGNLHPAKYGLREQDREMHLF
mgnify:CR=1 FL=1